jgi:hypothetical protein
MAQPTDYNKSTNFRQYAESNPAAPYNAAALDSELNNIEITLDETLTNLELIQRDDGNLQNGIVSIESLGEAIISLIGSEGWNVVGVWAAGTNYAKDDVVEFGTQTFVCVVSHISNSSFTVDRNAGRWIALTSVTDAASYLAAAQDAQAAAETAQAAAELAETNAETAETNAETAATTATNSASAASTSETNAAASELAAATSETNAATSESNAAASASAAAASYDSFDDRYLGSKAADPTLDNDGDALLTGALYWNSASNVMKVYNGASWEIVNAPPDGSVTTPKLVDGVLSADADGREKMADGYVTPVKLDTTAKPGKLLDIDAYVAASALTITINPFTADFRSTTLTDGTPVSRTLASPASLVFPNGATGGTVNGIAARFAVLAIDNAGVIEVAAVNLAGGNQLDETNLITTTTIGTGADSNNVIYSTTGRTNVAYRVVGFIDITEATAGVWATAPTLVQPTGGQALAALSSLGYGQTWQDVTGSRSSGVTYYNTTGRPIFFNVFNNVNNASSTVAVTVNGVLVSASVFSVASQNGRMQAGAIIPPGASYSYVSTGGAVAVVELR